MHFILDILGINIGFYKEGKKFNRMSEIILLFGPQLYNLNTHTHTNIHIHTHIHYLYMI